MLYLCVDFSNWKRKNTTTSLMEDILTLEGVLFKCIEGSSGVSPDQIGLNSSDATVCYECCRKLDNIAKLESKTEGLKKEIRNFLHLRADSVSEITTQCSSTGTPHRHQHKCPQGSTASTEN